MNIKTKEFLKKKDKLYNNILKERNRYKEQLSVLTKTIENLKHKNDIIKKKLDKVKLKYEVLKKFVYKEREKNFKNNFNKKTNINFIDFLGNENENYLKFLGTDNKMEINFKNKFTKKDSLFKVNIPKKLNLFKKKKINSVSRQIKTKQNLTYNDYFFNKLKAEKENLKNDKIVLVQDVRKNKRKEFFEVFYKKKKLNYSLNNSNRKNKFKITKKSFEF